jgi:hypothetical protein
MGLPETWIPLDASTAAKLEAELRRELPAGHALRDVQLRAIARRGAKDDVLFERTDSDGTVYCVHLTWSVESDPNWPWTVAYANRAEFVDRWPREESDDEL